MYPLPLSSWSTCRQLQIVVNVSELIVSIPQSVGSVSYNSMAGLNPKCKHFHFCMADYDCYDIQEQDVQLQDNAGSMAVLAEKLSIQEGKLSTMEQVRIGRLPRNFESFLLALETILPSPNSPWNLKGTASVLKCPL